MTINTAVGAIDFATLLGQARPGLRIQFAGLFNPDRLLTAKLELGNQHQPAPGTGNGKKDSQKDERTVVHEE